MLWQEMQAGPRLRKRVLPVNNASPRGAEPCAAAGAGCVTGAGWAEPIRGSIAKSATIATLRRLFFNGCAVRAEWLLIGATLGGVSTSWYMGSVGAKPRSLAPAQRHSESVRRNCHSGPVLPSSRASSRSLILVADREGCNEPPITRSGTPVTGLACTFQMHMCVQV